LRVKFKNEKFIRQLSVAKNYLYNVIQKSLIQSNADFSININLQLQLISVELLYEKGLLNQCLKQVHRLKEQCIKYDDYTLLDRLLDWEIRIRFKETDYVDAINLANMQIGAVKNRLIVLENKLKAIDIFSTKFGSPYDITLKRKSKEKRIAENLLNKPINKNEPVLAQYFYYSTINFYYSSVKDAGKRLYYSEIVFSLFKHNPDFASANTRLYIGALNNYCQALLGMNQYKKVRKLLDDVKKSHLSDVPANFKEMYDSTLSSIVNAELLLHLNSKRIDEALALEPLINEILIKDNNQLSDLHHFELNYYLALAFFMKTEYSKALDYINMIVHHSKKNSVNDIYFAAKIFILILHYELKNELLLINLSDTTLRYLKRQKILLEFDNKLIQFLKQQDANKKKKLLSALKEKINSVSDTKNFSLVYDYMNLKDWLNEK
jgi:hypothetical protein